MIPMQSNLRALVLAALVGATANVAAQSYPNRPIKVIVPFQAGSAPDQIMRFTTQHMQPLLGQPFVIENKPGAQGNIGPAGPAGPQGVAGPASLLATTGSTSFLQETIVNIPPPAVGVPSVCLAGDGLQFIGAQVLVTLTDVNENQRVSVTGTVVTAPARGGTQNNLILDLCYSKNGGLITNEGLFLGPLSSAEVMPRTLARTFGQRFPLGPGLYSFGVCGCVGEDPGVDAWFAKATVVDALLFQQ